MVEPLMALKEIFMMVINIGTRIGNERIAISVKLLFALDGMAETIVSKEEIPIEPNSKISKNIGIF